MESHVFITCLQCFNPFLSKSQTWHQFVVLYHCKTDYIWAIMSDESFLAIWSCDTVNFLYKSVGETVLCDHSNESY